VRQTCGRGMYFCFYIYAGIRVRVFTVNCCERRKQYFLYDVFGVVGEIVYSCILVDPVLGINV
jgi:hypothetical protein